MMINDSNTTMHHRTAATVKATTTSTAAANGGVDDLMSPSNRRTSTTRRKKRSQRRRRLTLFLSHPPSDIAIAVGTTVVLTVVTVLTVLHVWSRVTAPRSLTATATADLTTDDYTGGDVLPYNPIYTVPQSVETVGDRSDAYVLLRQRMDAQLPPNHPERSLAVVNSVLVNNAYAQLQPASMDVHHSDVVPYDIYHCPDTPPAGYPFQWNMVRVFCFCYIIIYFWRWFSHLFYQLK